MVAVVVCWRFGDVLSHRVAPLLLWILYLRLSRDRLLYGLLILWSELNCLGGTPDHVMKCEWSEEASCESENLVTRDDFWCV